MRKLAFFATILSVLILLTACVQNNSQDSHTDEYWAGYDKGYEAGIAYAQEYLAEFIRDRFYDIDQFSFGERSLSLDEAEAYLYCWADENSGMDISDEELREAIWDVLKNIDLIRKLISEIDEIEIS